METSFSDLPYELKLRLIHKYGLTASDLYKISQVSKETKSIVRDDYVWKDKIKDIHPEYPKTNKLCDSWYDTYQIIDRYDNLSIIIYQDENEYTPHMLGVFFKEQDAIMEIINDIISDRGYFEHRDMSRYSQEFIDYLYENLSIPDDNIEGKKYINELKNIIEGDFIDYDYFDAGSRTYRRYNSDIKY